MSNNATGAAGGAGCGTGRIIFIVVLAAVAAVAAVMVLQRPDTGVTRYETVVQSKSGAPLRAVIVRPAPAPTRPMPAVVAIPPYSIPPEAMEVICYELARRGATCAIPDFFGRSRAESRQHMGKDSLDFMTLDVLSLIGYLRSLPGVDARRIGVCGHSVGGTVTVLTGLADDGVAAAIPIGMEADFESARPHNLLFLSGFYDEIHSPTNLVGNLKDNGVTDDPDAGVLYGDLGRGAGRRVTIIPTTDHFIETFDPFLIRALLDWYAAAMFEPGLAAGRLIEWPRRVAGFAFTFALALLYAAGAGALAARLARRLTPTMPGWMVPRLAALPVLPALAAAYALSRTGIALVAPDLLIALLLAQEAVNQRTRTEMRWPPSPPYRLLRAFVLLIAALGAATILTYGIMSANLYLSFPKALPWYPVFALNMATLFPLEVWGRMRPWFFSELIGGLRPSLLWWGLLAMVVLAPGALFRAFDRVAAEILITVRARLKRAPAPAAPPAAEDEKPAASAAGPARRPGIPRLSPGGRGDAQLRDRDARGHRHPPFCRPALRHHRAHRAHPLVPQNRPARLIPPRHFFPLYFKGAVNYFMGARMTVPGSRPCRKS